MAPLKFRARRRGETTSRGDVVELRLVGPALVRVAIQRIPDESKKNSRRTNDDQKSAPSEGTCNPEQQRAQEGEAEILTDGVDARGGRSLCLREPGAQHAAVRRKCRRFRESQAHATGNERP